MFDLNYTKDRKKITK